MTQGKKMILTGKPEYLRDQIEFQELRNGKLRVCSKQNKLNIADEGFTHKMTTLMNLLPTEMIKMENLSKFKKVAKAWVRINVPQKPY